MNEFTLTTPGLLFSAISLLLLAYTNRFLSIASLIRSLHDKYLDEKNVALLSQIDNLRKRVFLIKLMQVVGVLSLFLCVLCMFLIFENKIVLGKITFGVALVLLLVSLAISIYEIFISANALNVQLEDIKEDLENQSTQ